MHQHARLAGTRAGQDEDVHLLPFIGHDPALNRVIEALNDGIPGCGGCLPRQILFAVG